MLDVVGERHAHLEVLAIPLDGEGYVVGQQERKVRAELVGDLGANALDLLRREVKHIIRDALYALELAIVDAVIGVGHVCERDVVGHLAKPDTLAHGDAFVAGAVDADGDVVVDAADSLHTVLLSHARSACRPLRTLGRHATKQEFGIGPT